MMSLYYVDVGLISCFRSFKFHASDSVMKRVAPKTTRPCAGSWLSYLLDLKPGDE